MTVRSKRISHPRVGSDFKEFLREEGRLAQATAVAVKRVVDKLSADPSGNTPEEFARFIRDHQAKWAKLMREAGIKPEGG